MEVEEEEDHEAPAGWTRAESPTSGQLSYENAHTGERIGWAPTEPSKPILKAPRSPYTSVSNWDPNLSLSSSAVTAFSPISRALLCSSNDRGENEARHHART